MKNTTKLALVALAGAVSTLAATEKAEAKKGDKEKCYGVAKAGKNDCGAKGHDCKGKLNSCAQEAHSCAGMAKHDFDPTEWVFVPKGLCEKLANGSLKAKAPEKS